MEKPKNVKAGTLSILRLTGTIIAVGLLVWLLAKQDWTVIWTQLSKLPVWIIIAALLLCLVGQVLNAWRWHVLLKAQDVVIKFSQTMRIVFAGAFASNFLPTTIGGDVLRLVSITTYTSNQGMSLASLVLDRLVNLAAFITVTPFSITVSDGTTTNHFDGICLVYIAVIDENESMACESISSIPGRL